jgi:hypothetical protein
MTAPVAITGPSRVGAARLNIRPLKQLRPDTQGSTLYPAEFRGRPQAAPELAYAATSGIGLRPASTRIVSPSVETVTCPPD